jgi:hypothetical protein
MDGPLGLALPHDPTLLDVFAVTGQDFGQEKLEEYTALARDVNPERERCIRTEREANDNLATLTRTIGELTEAIATADSALRKEQASAWDEVIQNPASDTRALAAHLRPLEDTRLILTDAKDLLVHRRIPAARLRRTEAVLATKKIEALDAQLLAAISHGRTVVAMKAAGVFEEEGELALIGKRTEQLRTIAREKMRLVQVAEADLREEHKRQFATEQIRMAQNGMITRAEVASAIPSFQGSSLAT